MKVTLFALFVALLMAGCGEDGRSQHHYLRQETLARIRVAKESGSTMLQLRSCSLSDLTPLAGLTNLKELRLPDNDITDLRPLARLKNLEELHLNFNYITDLRPLAGLTNLKELHLIGQSHPIPEDQKVMLRKALPNCWIAFGRRSAF